MDRIDSEKSSTMGTEGAKARHRTQEEFWGHGQVFKSARNFKRGIRLAHLALISSQKKTNAKGSRPTFRVWNLVDHCDKEGGPRPGWSKQFGHKIEPYFCHAAWYEECFQET